MRALLTTWMRTLLLIGAILFQPGASAAQDTGADAGPPTVLDQAATAWLRHLRQTMKRVFSIRTGFTQEFLSPADTGTSRHTSGICELRRGGRLRMTYDEPTRAVLISNPEETWYVDKENKVAYQLPTAETTWWPTFVESLLTTGDWHLFSVRHIGGASVPEIDGAPAVLQFTPNLEDRYAKSVVLTAAPEAPCIKRIVIVTVREDVIRITLEDPKTNVGIGAKRFTFTPPKWFRIVSQ